MTALSPRRGAYVPWLFIAGFGVIIAVNAVMIWFAVSSFSGLYSTNPREQGLHYNDVLARQKQRDALGWKVDVAWQPAASRLEIDVRDVSDQPIAGARVTANLVRPVEKRAPVVVAMEPVDIGRFLARIDLPAHGNWDVDIVVESAGQSYATTRRMFLQ
jgi:nitrogen fixation protein FixH